MLRICASIERSEVVSRKVHLRVDEMSGDVKALKLYAPNESLTSRRQQEKTKQDTASAAVEQVASQRETVILSGQLNQRLIDINAKAIETTSSLNQLASTATTANQQIAGMYYCMFATFVC